MPGKITKYTLFILPPNALSLREIGTLKSTERAELDACLLSCVSLLCGLQGSKIQPEFRLSSCNTHGRSTPVALLKDYATGWVTPDGLPFNVDTLL